MSSAMSSAVSCVHKLAPLAACLFLGGCLINSTRPLPTGAAAGPGRAVVVYGVAAEGKRDFPKLAVVLEEYNLSKQNISGNCMFHNQLHAVIPSAPGPVRYFAFDVPPGHYIYSPFNGQILHAAPMAFEAPSGRAVYIGDFIYTHENVVALRRASDAFEQERRHALPDLQGEVALARSQVVQRPSPFLCGP